MSHVRSPLPPPTTRWLKRVEQGLKAGLAVLLWGVPGVGKTAQLLTLATAWGVHLEVVIASIRDTTDFGGLPAIDPERGVFLHAPAWVHRLNAAAARDGRAILFLDELSTAPLAVQAALLRVVQERVVGEVALHPGVMVVAAANPPECSAGGIALAAPTANRWYHVNAAPPTDRASADAWADWLVAAAPKLGLDDAAGREAVAIVTGYVCHQPSALYSLPADEDLRSGPWASARSMEFATRALAATLRDDDAEGITDAIVGCVGPEVGTPLAAHARNRLPDIDGILDGRVQWAFDARRLDRSMTVLTALCTTALGRPVVAEEERAAAKTPAAKVALARAEYDRRSQLVNAAWQAVVGASDAGAPDCAVIGAKALLDWRDNRSGRAGDMTPAEARGNASLREYIKAKAAA
jgi:hypothetical protein